MKDTFGIDDVALMTGLSTRTIRNYIADGFLSGDKSSGAWQFTAEQLDAFFRNKTVQPTLHSKKNAIVYDFIGQKPRGEDKMCVVLDLTSDSAKRASALFCKYMSGYKPESAELRFASDNIGDGVRVILSGADSEVMALLNRYYAER
ncbi:MAG: helix-turn-helix domain-containing protein [Oscillospiraceae bacterium]|nr:helix-turn-helix domain-containing protein [Oscillospiraceae bacterium]